MRSEEQNICFKYETKPTFKKKWSKIYVSNMKQNQLLRKVMRSEEKTT
jgi:hypothetical protein